jgi:hypothetical protein
MPNLSYDGRVYPLAIINPIPEEIANLIKSIEFKEGECLFNSYKISKRINSVNVVEGFLVTLFENEQIDCVGHSWNEINGYYFDVTIGLKNHKQKIRQNIYYHDIKYNAVDAKFLDKITGKTDKFGFYITEKHLVFTSNVKTLERKIKIKLIKDLNDNDENDLIGGV